MEETENCSHLPARKGGEMSLLIDSISLSLKLKIKHLDLFTKTLLTIYQRDTFEVRDISMFITPNYHTIMKDPYKY